MAPDLTDAPKETKMDEVKPVEIHPDYAGNLRYQMQEWTEAERAIHAAMAAVERFPGGSLHLTNATILLAQARQAVAQHILSLAPVPQEG